MVLCAPIMKTTRSAKLFAEAQQLIPGGVNSPVRAFRSVGGQPRFIKRAKGARLYDVDGNSYIDYVLSWGPMILGHAAPSVVSTIKRAAANGTSYGAPTELEVMLARMIHQAFPSMEKGPARQLRHRGGHERDSCRPWLYEARQYSEI